MKQKLKELSKYCCEPKSEAEFLAVKLAAEKGDYSLDNMGVYSECYSYIAFSVMGIIRNYAKSFCTNNYKEIPVHEYCELLMKDESEFDRRYELDTDCNFSLSNDVKSFIAHKGYHWEVNGNEVSLLKD